MLTSSTTTTSSGATPSTFPQSSDSKFTTKLRCIEIRMMPIAKLAEVIAPIAASAPIERRRATRLMNSAATSPQAPAPRKTFTPKMELATAPPKIAWERPWPM